MYLTLVWIISFLVTVLLCLVIFWYYVYLSFYARIKQAPMFTHYPLLGGALSARSLADSYEAFLRMSRQNGQFLWTMIGFDAYMFVMDSKCAKTILTSKTLITKATVYDIFKVALGEGLLTSSGETYWSHKKMILPGFHPEILKDYCRSFDEYGSILVEELKKENECSIIDIGRYIDLCIMGLVCETAMGMRLGVQEDKDSSRFMQCLQDLDEACLHALFKPLQMISGIFHFISWHGKIVRDTQYVEQYTLGLIRQRRADLLQNKAILRTTRRMSFIDLLLSQSDVQQTITDDELRDEVNTFMSAGIKTTSTAICFALHLLAKNPKVQQNAFVELKNVFADEKDRSTTYNGLQKLTYLDLVIKETLRLYPTVPWIARKLTEDVQCGDRILPKGLNVVILTSFLSNTDDAEVFDPERVVSPDDSADNPLLYIPFSMGPRRCIGQMYAKFAMKAIISKLLRNFELIDVNHELEIKTGLTLISKTGFKVGLRRRCW